MNFRKLLLSFLGLTMGMVLSAQTTLDQGDLWIVGMDGQFNNDAFSFVCLVDLQAGTEIFFSDQPADGDSTHPAPGNNSATIKYTAPAGGLKAGTVIVWAPPTSTATNFDIDTAGTGVMDISLGSNGDKIIAFQGSSGLNATTYLAALANNASWGTFPTYFTNGINFGLNQDGEYNGVRNSTRANLISLISDTASWNFLNGSENLFPNYNDTVFNVGYYWDGTTWSPSSPDGNTGLTDDIIVDGTGATITSATTTTENVIVESTGDLDASALLTADSIIIKSDASGQGQVKGSVTGDVEFQSYITSTGARWFNMGSPVDGALSKVTFTNGGILRTQIDLDSASTNIYYYDPETPKAGQGKWLPEPNQTSLANARGRSIYLGGGGVFGTLPMVISTYGALNSGNVNTTISTSNSGWNFVTNPYAATIDLDEVDNDNLLLNDNYYIRNVELGQWQSWDALNNTGNPGASAQYVAGGQAFFVQTTSPTILAFQEDQIIMTQDPGVIRGQSMELVQLKVSTSELISDNTTITLKSGSVDSKNPIIDGVKRMNDGSRVPSLYSALQGENYVSKYIDDQFSSRIIPIYLEHDIDDELTITAEMLTINNGLDVMLEDKLSGDMIDLRQGAYTFRHLEANDPDRFVLHFSQSTIGFGEASAQSDAIFAYTQGESVFVNLEDLNQEVSIQLFDMGGKMLMNQNTNGGQVHELRLPSQSQGVFLLKVVADGQLLHSQKIMK